MHKMIFVMGVVVVLGISGEIQAAAGRIKMIYLAHDMPPEQLAAYNGVVSSVKWQTTDLYHACLQGNKKSVEELVPKLKQIHETRGMRSLSVSLGRYFRLTMENGHLDVADYLLSMDADWLYGANPREVIAKALQGESLEEYSKLKELYDEISK